MALFNTKLPAAVPTKLIFWQRSGERPIWRASGRGHSNYLPELRSLLQGFETMSHKKLSLFCHTLSDIHIWDNAHDVGFDFLCFSHWICDPKDGWMQIRIKCLDSDLPGGVGFSTCCHHLRSSTSPSVDQSQEKSFDESLQDAASFPKVSKDAWSHRLYLHCPCPHWVCSRGSGICWRGKFSFLSENHNRVVDCLWTGGCKPVGQRKASEHNPSFGEAVAGFSWGFPGELWPHKSSKRSSHGDRGEIGQVWKAHPCLSWAPGALKGPHLARNVR